MSKLPNTRKILSDDFPKEAKTVIDKLAFILNKFMQDVVSVVNGNLDFDNFRHQKVSFELKIDASGNPIGNDIIRNTMQDGVVGIECIRAVSLDTVDNFPTATPFINYDYGTNGQLRVKHATGLVPNEKYNITVILY